jgi:hypothetical protein
VAFYALSFALVVELMVVALSQSHREAALAKHPLKISHLREHLMAVGKFQTELHQFRWDTLRVRLAAPPLIVPKREKDSG